MDGMTSTTSSSNQQNNYSYYENFQEVINAKLHEAVQQNDIQRAKEYLANGAHIECKNSNGETVLSVALQNRYKLLLTLLIEVYRADVNAIDDGGCSALMIACEIDCLYGLTILIAHGADINRPDGNGDTPLHYCVLRKSRDTCKYLLERADINPNAKDYVNNMTPIHYACMDSVFDIVDMLSDRIDINLDEIDGDRNTPLHLACRSSNFQIAKCLIDKGCDINARDAENRLPLDVACGTNSLAIVKILLSQQRLIRDFSKGVTKTYLQTHSVLGFQM